MEMFNSSSFHCWFLVVLNIYLRVMYVYCRFCPLTYCEYMFIQKVFMFWNSLFVKFLGSNSWPGTVFNMFVIIGFLMKESLPAKQWAVLLLSMKEIPPVV